MLAAQSVVCNKNFSLVKLVDSVKHQSPSIIRLAISAIGSTKQIESDNLNSTNVNWQQNDKIVSKLVKRVLKIDSSNGQEIPPIIWGSGFSSARDYVLSQLEQQLWDQNRVELDRELRSFDALLLAHSNSQQVSSEDIVGSQESPGPMAREITTHLDKREAELIEKEQVLKTQRSEDSKKQIEHVQLQLEELKKARKDFEKFLEMVRTNKEMVLFDKDPSKRQEQYHRFANQLFPIFNVLKERSEEEYFFSQIPNLLEVCYTAWHENINQMRQLAGLETKMDNPIYRANWAVRNLRREIFLKHALPLALNRIGFDSSRSNDVHYQLACKRILNDRYHLGYSSEELGNHEEHIVEVIRSNLLRVAEQIFDERYTLDEVRKYLQEYYKGLSDDQKEILFTPFLDYYKEELLHSRAPVLDDFLKLEELYKNLERCNQIDEPIHRQRELELLAREFREQNLEVPFSIETPLESLHKEIDRFNSRSSYLGCYTACKLALNSSKNFQEAAQKIRNILDQEKVKHGLEDALLLANEKGKATVREEEWASRQGVARETQQMEQIIQKAIDSENPEQVKARLVEHKKLIEDRLASLKEVKANLNAKIILKHTITNNKELSSWGVSLFGILARILKPTALDGKSDKITHELLDLAKAWNPIRKEEKVLLIAALKQDGMALKRASEDLRSDPEIVKLAVQQNWEALEYAGYALKNDPEIVMLAVQQNGRALQHAGYALKNDPKVVKLAVQQNWQALQFAGEIPKNDPEIVMLAVQQNWEALKCAGDIPKNDPEIVKLAVQQKGDVLQYAGDTLKNDPEIVKLAVQQNWEALKCAGDIPKNDPEIVMLAVQQNWKALKRAGDIPKNDPKIVKLAVQQNWEALEYAGYTLKNDPEIVMLAVQQNWLSLKDAGDIPKNDPEIVKLAVQQSAWALFYAGDIPKNSHEVIKLAVQKGGGVLQIASDKFRNDPEIVKLAVQKDGLALYYAIEMLKNDPEIVKLAVQQNWQALQFAGEIPKNNPEIVKLAVQQDPQAISYADPALRNDPEILAVVRNE